MKKSEIALLILIVGAVGIATYFLVGSLASGLNVQPVEGSEAHKIQASIADMEELGKTIFQEGAYNPTIKITIGGEPVNEQPFNATQP